MGGRELRKLIFAIRRDSVGREIRLRDRPPVLASSPLLKSIGLCTVSVTAGHEFFETEAVPPRNVTKQFKTNTFRK